MLAAISSSKKVDFIKVFFFLNLIFTDAKYVQVIHTSGGFLGVKHPIGHAGNIFKGFDFDFDFNFDSNPNLQIFIPILDVYSLCASVLFHVRSFLF